MNITVYQILHFIGLAALCLGLGGMMANGANRKAFSILQGIGLLAILVSGFGMLAKLHLGFPHFAIVKTVLWVFLGAFPVLVRKLKIPVAAAGVLLLVLVGVLAWLGLSKPALW